jgi:hypothetical protein
MDPSQPKFWSAFISRDDLKQFEVDALLLFALQLRFGVDDIFTVAANSLTEGSDDKKADMVYIDTDSGHAVIAQTYLSQKLSNIEAPANKASDLNAAVSWLLSRPLDELPITIKSHAEELRRAIRDKEITTLHIWYVHNLRESKNVQDELKTVEHTAQSSVYKHFPDSAVTEIQTLEVGINTLEDWYKSVSTPILVTDNFKIPIKGGYKESASDWQAYITSIPASWFYDNFHKYKAKLFSANVRDYLGSRDIDANINFSIKNTASEDPNHFWVYNNGITALVHNFKEIKKNGDLFIEFNGISIVNGAQTTGAIGSLGTRPNEGAMIPVRFITCRNASTIQNIVRYNNSQNKITAPDFRSNDRIQTKLQMEFEYIPNVVYSARRGGHEDVIRRRPNLLPSVTAGQALAALHQNPDIAYHQKTKIWVLDDLYARYFNDNTSARHIVFAYSLLLSAEKKKVLLLSKSRNNSLAIFETDQLNFFRLRGSTFLLSSAIATCLEVFLDKPIPNSFRLIFKDNISPEQGAIIWEPIVEVASAFTNSLSNGLSDGFKNQDAVSTAIRTFRDFIVSTKSSNSKIYAEFAKRVA